MKNILELNSKTSSMGEVLPKVTQEELRDVYQYIITYEWEDSSRPFTEETFEALIRGNWPADPQDANEVES